MDAARGPPPSLRGIGGPDHDTLSAVQPPASRQPVDKAD